MKRLLVVTQTAGWRHDVIPVTVETVRALGEETGSWEVAARVEAAADVARAVTAEGLRGVDAVVFANTSGDLDITDEGRAAFFAWMRDGGAFVGIHSASDTFHGDAEYLGMIGGEFDTHGPERGVEVYVQDPEHPACRGLPASFPLFEEVYEFRHWERGRVHALLALHAHPQTGDPADHPVAWTRRFGRGRVFYTALGHREEVYANALVRRHLAGGIAWAVGLAPGDDTPGNPIV